MKAREKTKEELVQEFRIQGIRDAASRVVAARGIEGATIEAIAEEAGIAKGTIYLYFANREDLLDQAADHALVRLLEELEEVFTHPGGFRAQLQIFIRSMLNFFAENREFFRLYKAACERSEENGGRHRRYQDYFRRLTEWMQDAIERQQVRPLDPERLALVVSETLSGVVRRRLAEESSIPVADETEWLAAVLLDGIAAPEREAAH